MAQKTKLPPNDLYVGDYKIADTDGKLYHEGTVIDPAGVYVPLEGITSTVAQTNAVLVTEEGAGVYTGSVSVPAGAIIQDVIVHAIALWDAATSAVMIVGDVADPNGFFAAVNLKATDLLAGESVSFAEAGGKGGADVSATHISRRYLATARTVSIEVTSVGAGTAGRTLMTVIYTVPVPVAATFVAAE